MSADTPENRSYIQRHRLWLLGEVITMNLLNEKPEKPLTAIVKILEKERNSQTEAVDSPTPEVAAAAKDYIQKHQITGLFEEWLRNAVEAKPENPLEFSIAHFQKLAAKAEGYAADAADPTPAA